MPRPRLSNRTDFGTVWSDSNTAAAGAATATAAAVANSRNVIQGFIVTGGGATSASIIDVTVTGVPTTLKFKLVIPAGATVAIVPLMIDFGDGLAASADNTAIVVSVPSFGTGNTAAAVAAWGYRE